MAGGMCNLCMWYILEQSSIITVFLLLWILLYFHSSCVVQLLIARICSGLFFIVPSSKLYIGLWVWLTLLPTLILNSKQEDTDISLRDYVGWILWLFGMVIEAVADYQKYTFRSNPANR